MIILQIGPDNVNCPNYLKFRIDSLNHRRSVLSKYLQEFVDESEVIETIKETCHRDLEDIRTELNSVQQASYIFIE